MKHRIDFGVLSHISAQCCFGMLCATIATSASAEAKHVKFTTEIVVDGQPVVNEIKCPSTDGKRACQTPFTVGELAYMSLERAPAQGMAPQSWADAIKRDDLAHAIRNADDFLLLDDQRTLIETAIAPIWNPALLGFVARVIDPPAEAAAAPAPANQGIITQGQHGNNTVEVPAK